MTRGWLLLPVFMLLSGPITSARGSGEGQAILDKAILAVGGEERVGQLKAMQTRIRGTIFPTSGGDLAFTADTFNQPPGQFKHVMEYVRAGIKTTQIQFYTRDTVAILINGSASPLDDDLRTALKKGRYADDLTTLTFIKDRESERSLLGETSVNGRPALGVKVTAKGRPDVALYFDKESSLLVKTEHRQLDPSTRQEITQEVYYSDYRDPLVGSDTILQAAGLAVDNAALLEFFRQATVKGDVQERISALIRLLGDERFAVREKATADLVAIGAAAMGPLKQALLSSDAEVRRRAERCLDSLHKDSSRKEMDQAIPVAAARLLELRQPEGAVEALLAYLPFASDERVAAEIRAVLTALAVRDGKPDPVLLRALGDNHPLRRAAAAEALGKVPGPAGRLFHISGLKRPMKVAIFRDSRKFMEWEVLDVAYFTTLDARLFALP